MFPLPCCFSSGFWRGLRHEMLHSSLFQYSKYCRKTCLKKQNKNTTLNCRNIKDDNQPLHIWAVWMKWAAQTFLNIWWWIITTIISTIFSKNKLLLWQKFILIFFNTVISGGKLVVLSIQSSRWFVSFMWIVKSLTVSECYIILDIRSEISDETLVLVNLYLFEPISFTD